MNIKDLLVDEERFAPDQQSVWSAVSAGSSHRRVTRRRLLIGGVAAGVAAITAGAAVLRRQPNSTALPGPSPTTRTAPTAVEVPRTVMTSATDAAARPGVAQATDLPSWRWQTLPVAPIATRSSAAAGWTGSEMLVWGGFDDRGPLLDGAAYDPLHRTWRRLPAAPAGAHARWQGVWTGTSFVLFGVPDDSSTARPTGARYMPATDRWRVLPDAPFGISAMTLTVWTGKTLLALAVPAGKEPQHVAAASFDQETDSWYALPPLDLPAGHPVDALQVASADGTVYLWSRWQRSVTEPATNTTTTTVGTDCFRWQESRWNPFPFTDADGINGSQPVWTGAMFVQPAAARWSGSASRGPRLNGTGRLLDPATGKVTPIAKGPVDALAARSLWTGTALLSFDSQTFTSDGRITRYPGEAAVWDPRSNSWTVLPSSEFMSDGSAVAFWTGSSLLMWGKFFDARSANDAAPGRVVATGVEFAPRG